MTLNLNKTHVVIVAVLALLVVGSHYFTPFAPSNRFRPNRWSSDECLKHEQPVASCLVSISVTGMIPQQVKTADGKITVQYVLGPAEPALFDVDLEHGTLRRYGPR